MRIKEINNMSSGNTAVMIIDYMMKYEETRARESSREHYGKRGIVVHGAMIKYTKEDGSLFKRVYYTAPEGDGTQDAKATLAYLDVILHTIRKEDCLTMVHNLIIISDNAGKYFLSWLFIN